MDAQTHLSVYFERIRLLIQRYMRRFCARLVRSSGAYSDMCVGPEELGRILGTTQHTPKSTESLDKLGIPSLEQLEQSLKANAHKLKDVFADVDEDTVLPIEEIRAGFMLNEMELDLLLAAVAPSLSVDMMHLYTVAWSDFTVRRPTAGFLADVVSSNDSERQQALTLLSDTDRLVGYRLLLPTRDERWKEHTPRVHAPIEVPQRILDVVVGQATASSPLPGCQLHPLGVGIDALVLDDAVHAAIRGTMRGSRAARICLMGPKSSGRGTLAQAFASDRGQCVLEVDLARALGAPIKADQSATTLIGLGEILREARLHRALLLIRCDGLEDSGRHELLKQEATAVRRLFDSYPEVMMVAASHGDERWVRLMGEFMDVSLPVPSGDTQRRLWSMALEKQPLSRNQTKLLADELSRTYRLPPGAIFRAVQSARQTSRPNAFVDGLSQAIRRQFDHNLGWLADTMVVEIGLDDVVLTQETRGTLEKVLAFARQSEQVFRTWDFQSRSHGGNGLAVLFSGPPGTGKTLVAGVLARELGRVLYRVDLSRIVDKYIGETEKNLRRVFDEAERAHAVLLFDEADSLFGKRTQVKSSNDRYANLEVNYLLQRLESYDGMSILTTNLATSLDEAFQRRIRFKVEFEVPSPKLRARLWRTLIPPKAPVETNVDWDKLGETFAFSGGHIRNAILRAAIDAANRDTAIGYQQLHDAAIAESRDMGNLVRD